MSADLAKRKRGRPSNKERAVTDDGRHWVDRMMDNYKQGYSDYEICADLNIPWKEFDRRMREDDVFAQVVEIGRLFSKAWWYSQGRLNLKNKEFSPTLWFAIMKNRFGWSEKNVASDENDKPLDQKSTEELKAEVLTKYKNTIKGIANVHDVKTAMEILNAGSKQVN